MDFCSSLVTRRQLSGLVGLVGFGAPALALSIPNGQSWGLGNWAAFKTRFVAADGRIVDTGNGGISHSEGQAYGMLLAEAAGDRDAFDRIWKWADDNLARPDVRLFSWRLDPRLGVTDKNNATDGDLMIAWALYKAAKRWSVDAYSDSSKQVRSAILKRLVVKFGGRTLLLPGLEGFVRPDTITVNPSYFVFPALDQFAKLDSRSAWSDVRDESLRLVREGVFGPYNLPVDWLTVDKAGRLWAAPDRPPTFGFDAIRIALYLLWSQRDNDQAIRGIRRFWATVRTGNGDVPASFDVSNGAFATYSISGGARRLAELTTNGRLNALLPPADGDYYSTVLWCLAALAAA